MYKKIYFLKLFKVYYIICEVQIYENKEKENIFKGALL